jgi:hypothetical protein
MLARNKRYSLVVLIVSDEEEKFYNIDSRANCYKKCPQFTNVANKLECLFLASLFSLVSCLLVRPGVYLRVEHLQSASLTEAQALPTTIKLGWKGLQGTSTLAYYGNL